MIIGFSATRLRAFSLVDDGKELKIKRGALIKGETMLKWDEISSITVKRGLLDLLFGSAECILNVEGKQTKKADFCFKLSFASAKELFLRPFVQKMPRKPRRLTVKNALLAAASSSVVAGFAAALPTASFIGNALGIAVSELIINEMGDEKSIFGVTLPPIASILTLLVIISYTVAFVVEFFKNIAFYSFATKREICIVRGFFARRYTILLRKRVQGLVIEQNLLMRACKKYAVQAVVAGYGNLRGEKSMIIPFCSKEALKRLLRANSAVPSAVWAEMSPVKARETKRRFLLPARALGAAIISTAALLSLVFPLFYRFFAILGAAALALSVGYRIVREAAYKKSRVLIGDRVWAVSSEGLRLKALCLKKENIGALGISQSPFSRRYGTATLKISCFSERGGKIKVRMLELEKLKQVLTEKLNFDE